MTVKGWLFGLCIVCSSLLSHAAEPGESFGTIGLGFAPLYVEEVVTDNRLTAGATVNPIHLNSQLGYYLNPSLALLLSTSQDGYVDANQNIYLTGVTGVGLLYSPNEFANTHLRFSAGLGAKAILGELDSTTGFGVNLGFHQWINSQWALDASYHYIQLNAVSSVFASGDEEAISALHLGVTYRWF